MTTENTNTTENKPKGFSSQDLNMQIAEKIITEAPQAIESVIKTLVARELDKRAQALLGGVELATTLKRDLAKIDRPDIPSLFGRDGKPLGEGSWSKGRLSEIDKLTKKLVKVEKAIETSTRRESPDFALLYALKGEIEKMDKEIAPTE